MRSPRSAIASAAGLVGFLAAVAMAAGIGAQASLKPKLWYRLLKKPPFNPPDKVFGPVWSALYALIAVSGWQVWRAPKSPERRTALALWAGQLALNAQWSRLFFGQHRPQAALVDLAATHALSTAYALKANAVTPSAGWMFTPYLAWLTFAGVLNEEIVRRN